MESKFNKQRRRKYPSKKRTAASKAAQSRWNKTDGPPAADHVRSDPLETAPPESANSLEQSIPSACEPSVGASHASSEFDSQGLPSSSVGHSILCSPVSDVSVTPTVQRVTSSMEFDSPGLQSVSENPPLHVNSPNVTDGSMESVSAVPSVREFEGQVMPICDTPKRRFGVSLATELCTSTPVNVSNSFSQLDTSFSSVGSPDSVYAPDACKNLMWKRPVVVNRFLFVGESTQLIDLVNQINSSCSCKTAGCKGHLIPHEVVSTGLGGSVEVKLICNGCWARTLSFNSSSKHVVPRQGHQLTSVRTIVSLALQVAHFVFGSSYRQYYKTLKMGLGIPVVSEGTFNHVIEMVYGPVADMLREQTTEALEQMKTVDPRTIGSFQRAVTAGDGTWLQRKFSKNFTFTLRNYMNNSLLYFVHLCMRGKDNIVPGELFLGTSKAAEGHGADLAFSLAKKDDLQIEVHWQDGDSSTATAFRKHYPDESKHKVLLCGGHIARAFEKNLKEYKTKKRFGDGFVRLHECDFPTVSQVECHCKLRHSYSKGCGCLSDSFIKQARLNLYCCLVQAGSNPDAFATGMRNLGKYHSKDIHEWGGGSCNFHKQRICACKQCKDEVLCEGKEYHTRSPLKCPLHSLAFEIECERRASQAADVIHPELGRGSTNIAEASHNVLTKFRSKDQSLQRLHYTTSTNIGLLQANMTYMYNKRGPEYHWILDLYSRLGLPVFENMQEYLKLENEKRMKALVKQKTIEAKEKRIKYKAKRAIEQEKRRRWVKQQAIQHTYGSDEDEDDSQCRSSKHSLTTVSDMVISSKGKTCKCGSTSHLRPTHKECPLRKQTVSAVAHFSESSDSDSGGFSSESLEDESDRCTCGALDAGRRAHHCSCPLNCRNIGKTSDEIFKKVIPSTDSRQDELDTTISTSVDEGRTLETTTGNCSDSASQNIQPTINPHKRKVASPSSSLKRTKTDSDSLVCPCGVNVRAHKRACPLNLSHRRRDKQLKSSDDLDVLVTGESETNPVLVTGPLPSQEWKAAAVDVLKKWSKCSINIVTNPTIRKVRCAEIAPHVRDRIVGDGHCFFRTLSKEITGTEINHKAVRQALVNFMRDNNIAPGLASYLFHDDVSHSPVELMERYIKKSNMHLAAWATDKEIFSAATLLQVGICIFSDFGFSGRQWLRFKPIFTNENCLAPSNFNIYIYHTRSGDHYDRVCPCLH